MFIFKQALLFWSLATEETKGDIWSKEDYDTFVSEIDNHYPSQMMTIIHKYHNKPYFKLEDFLEPIWEQLGGSSGPINIVEEFKRASCPDDIIKKIMQYMADRLISSSSPFNERDYLWVEKISDLISSETLEKAQRKIILYLMDSFKFDMSANESDSYGSGGHKTAAVLWEKLYNKSNKFPKVWLEELAKKFGADFYAYVMSYSTLPATDKKLTHQQNIHNRINNNDKLSIYDIALLFSPNIIRDGFTPEEMKTIISKVDDQAFAYMRTFLYTDSITIWQGNQYFMLDENGKLMDINYNTVEWPSSTYVAKPNDLAAKPELKEKWVKIFEEFNVIPA